MAVEVCILSKVKLFFFNGCSVDFSCRYSYNFHSKDDIDLIFLLTLLKKMMMMMIIIIDYYSIYLALNLVHKTI